MKNNLRKKLAGVICLASALAGFSGGYFAGRKTQEVDHISIHNEGDYIGDYKIVKLHKLYGENDIFVSMNGAFWDNYERDYFPIRPDIENSYGKNTDFSEKRISDVYTLVSRESK